jgi:hypothetical protein
MAPLPVEYFRSPGTPYWLAAWAGEAVIRALMTINGRLVTRCLALGPYLGEVAARFCARTEAAYYYYGVDVNLFRPADAGERAALRRRLGLPLDRFLIVLASRVSHEKDPETVIRAVARARQCGLDAMLLNLGGDYRQFVSLARADVPGPDDRLDGLLHPMTAWPTISGQPTRWCRVAGRGPRPVSPSKHWPVKPHGCDRGRRDGGPSRDYAGLAPRRDVEAMAKRSWP